MPSWRRPRRRLLGWLSNSRKNSGSGGETAAGSRQPATGNRSWLLLVAPIARKCRLNASFSQVGGAFWENGVCWVVFNDVGGFD